MVTVADHPLVQARILTWTPMQSGQPYIAMIEGAPWVRFTAPTALAAYKKADEFRKESAERTLKSVESKLRGAEARAKTLAAKREAQA